MDSAIHRLGRAAAAALENPDDLITPLSSFDSFDNLRQTLRAELSTGDALANFLEEIDARMSGLEARIVSATRSHRVNDDTRYPSNSHVMNARRIFEDPEKLGEFLRGELTDTLPLGVLINLARRCEAMGFVDFNASKMSRPELQHHLTVSRERMLKNPEADKLYLSLVTGQPVS